jgi:hypothetical protein
MNTNIDQRTGQGSPQGSAIIIQFPVGGRAARSVHHAETAIDRTMQHNPNVMYGSSWYHDEAIAQSIAPTKG